MMRLLLLIAAVVCCNACRLESFPEDTTNNPQGCSDSDGNLHEFNSEWDNGPENCVCVDFGVICCEKTGAQFETDVPPEPTTPQIIADDFGAFTWNEPEEPSSSEEHDSHEDPNEPNEPEPEPEPKPVDSSEADDSHETAEEDNE